jgi:hypothetical protein
MFDDELRFPVCPLPARARHRQPDDHPRRGRRGPVAASLLAWVALALTIVAVAVILILAITSGDGTSVKVSAPATTAPSVPGVR